MSAPVSGETLRPGDAPALAELLAACSREGRALRLKGGGSHDGAGNPLRRTDATVDLSGLSGVLDLDAEEGVVHAAGGTPLAELARQVEQAGWELPLDPPGEAATLGGTLAAAAPGPCFPRPRDIVLGLSVVLAGGERTRSGGRVVKNVTGYDLAKLHVGGWGSLGVIESAWLRLQAPPEQRLLLECRGASAEQALAAARLATARAVGLEAGQLLVELAGDAPAVEADRRRLPELEPASADPASSLRRLQRASAAVRLRVAALPSKLGPTARALEEAGARALVWPRAGLVYARFDRPEDLSGAMGRLGSVGAGPTLLERAPGELLEQRDAFGEPGPLLPLYRALKQRFDPAGVLNPGRFAGRL